MNEYRVVSAKVFETHHHGIHVSVIYFYPQYRNKETIEISNWKDSNDPKFYEYCDEDGWMFFPGMVKYDNLESAYGYIDRLEEINEYGRKIHPYPAK
jgi:hypothetical protein